ncbi:MAG: oligosaccharide flippase family protein, partial [Rhodopila sp.]|nr:oligosaccharide flippase family protein [Rhodopila sp.]
GFSFWAWAGGLALMVWSRADAFLLAPVLGTAAFGFYLLAGEIAMMPVTELLEPACATLTPGFALARRNGTASVSMGLTVGGILALGTIPFAIGVSACSGYLVTGLLGPNWQAARPLIAIITWSSMFSPFSYVCGSVLTAHGQVRRVFICNAVAAALKVLVVLVVRETHDLMTISIAAVAVMAAESSIFVFQLRATGGIELRQLRVAMTRAALSTAATCAVLRLLPGTWDVVTLDRIPALAVGAAIGLLTFFVFSACQLLLWRMAGCPAGVEARLIEALREVVRPPAWLKSVWTNVQV